ncbi:hypothetical protein OJF2_55830 [Aquisphaera giovannonii]|uniref:Bacterial membrane protein YfhO n=1 Tax=Aquisphaera giovannonii TaxID=406548 RepID=A0A5B9W8P8_9BACT|nr:hypothetical protein [Aquisphaera giovannonii]QEH36998.1 hypothetical protein OJF2_55830 [Aquisphaera giovannonii]
MIVENQGNEADRRSSRVAVSLILLAGAIQAWLWPVGIGGKMPVGGDVTRFFLGLMDVLSQSLKSRRLPFWNDLWGDGFPGVGESQMGVFYPPHLLLYGLLATEYAYVGSLVIHTLWGGFGAWWAARRFGASPAGAGLAAFAFSASGFFVIHATHQWGYTTGSWMPWAWGLAWSVLDRSHRRAGRDALLLAAVLALQVLPGHFQVAFLTEVGVAILAACGAAERGLAGARRVGLVLIALLAVLPLSAVQVWPTARLAVLAASQRDFGYLSGFAATPFHLVSFVAPDLFHHSPFWRPLVWDPLHTSPEEMLAYIGLVPAFLAVLAVLRDSKRDAATRALAVLAGLTLLLSLGPYVPGFRLLIRLPGFSFFRAPARWTLATSLAMALLAGKGLDRCREWPRLPRSLALLSALGIAWILATVGLLELAQLAGRSGTDSWLSAGFERAFRARPWADDPDFRAVIALARRSGGEGRRPAGISSRPGGSEDRTPRNFEEARGGIYARELAGPAAVLGGVLLVAGLAAVPPLRDRRGFLPSALLLLSFADLMALGIGMKVPTGPLRTAPEMSPVMAYLSSLPRGTRVADTAGNFSMRAGLSPITAYRTLDLPTVPGLAQLASGPLDSLPVSTAVRKAMRAEGVGVRVLSPAEVEQARRTPRAPGSPPPLEGRLMEDPALAEWLYGPDPGGPSRGPAGTFSVVRPGGEPARAWLVPLTGMAHPEILDSWGGEPGVLLELFDGARPLRHSAPTPERWEIVVDAAEPGWIVISMLADPQWKASWIDGAGGSRDAQVLPTFRRSRSDGGWQRVKVPGSGRWTLRLEYRANDVEAGAAASAVAWLAWGVLWLRGLPRGPREGRHGE